MTCIKEQIPAGTAAESNAKNRQEDQRRFPRRLEAAVGEMRQFGGIGVGMGLGDWG